MNFKKIHIGSTIKAKFQEEALDMQRACSFMKCTESEIEQMFLEQDLTTDKLLRWSKLLEYDFFRAYSQHLILFSPPKKVASHKTSDKKTSSLPAFRKNIYTKEIIEFILEQIETGKKTKLEIINDYKIPKTTLYKWIAKYTDKNK
ncbi:MULTISPECIES: transposase [Chryseobacterium]|uniref:transposase n=1 Tax=Chryseobacterium TaxID=59732 RepID=UPI00192DC460|nr:transposase [Chryseobacterium cucumeris]QRA41481.1 transposase [Chryseobacterium cucumeris]